MKLHEIFFICLLFLINTSAGQVVIIQNLSGCEIYIRELNVNDNDLNNSVGTGQTVKPGETKPVNLSDNMKPVAEDLNSVKLYPLQFNAAAGKWVFELPQRKCQDACTPGGCDCCGAIDACTKCDPITNKCVKPNPGDHCNNCCMCRGAYNPLPHAYDPIPQGINPYTCKADTCQIPVTGAVCGDPHFKTWHGEHFSYHGECDLVLMKADEFSNGLGLRIHIRTKIEQSWSYVKFAAIKIGNDVLEVQGQGEVWDKSAAAVHYVNGELNAELPFKLSGKYPVIRVQEKQCSVDKSKCVEAIIYKVDLFEAGSIQVTQKWGVLRVGVTVGGSNDFEGSVGLMGHLSEPGFWARDGITKFKDVNINQFGQEWQVQESEPMIFNERRAPQHPEQCLLPTVSTKRRLGEDSALHQMALDACAGVEEASKEFCLLDVTAAGRVEAASTYYTAYVG